MDEEIIAMIIGPLLAVAAVFWLLMERRKHIQQRGEADPMTNPLSWPKSNVILYAILTLALSGLGAYWVMSLENAHFIARVFLATLVLLDGALFVVGLLKDEDFRVMEGT